MDARLYGVSFSYPSRAARLMLQHKGIEHEWVKLTPGAHPFLLRFDGFREGTVPALRLDGRRVVGSRRISRLLDELRPEPPLFPADAVAGALAGLTNRPQPDGGIPHPVSMRAAVLDAPGRPLRITEELPDPVAGRGQVRLRVSACGVCRTDLHLLDGELRAGHLPLVLGHQIVGVREDTGERAGVPWLGWTCGRCAACLSGRENLCPDARFTGCDIDGGFAELAVTDERYCLPLPDGPDDVAIAPLLCGGLIGYRALRIAGYGEALGLYGFGSAAHMICQVAVHQGRRVYAFTRPGDAEGQAFARDLGATWAGGVEEMPPEPLDAAIVFAPDGALVPAALRAVAPGGTVVCGGIHMSDIPSFPYALLWGERVLRSVANLTRADGREFLEVAAQVPVRTRVTTYPLDRAQDALEDLRAGRIAGSAVITVT